MGRNDERDQFEFGTPSHLGYLKMAEGDSRRDKRRCVHYDKKTGYCNRKRHNVNLNLRYCSGSSQCDRYSEMENQTKSSAATWWSSEITPSKIDGINNALRERYIAHVRKEIVEKMLGIQWECCVVAGQGIREVKKTRGRKMKQITKSRHDALLNEVVLAMFRYREAKFSKSSSRIGDAKQRYKYVLGAFLEPYSCKVNDVMLSVGLSIVDDEADRIHEVAPSTFWPRTKPPVTEGEIRERKANERVEHILPQKMDDCRNEATVSRNEIDEDVKKAYLRREDREGTICKYRSIDSSICNAPGSRNYKRVCGGAAGCPYYARRTEPVQKRAVTGTVKDNVEISEINYKKSSAIDIWIEQMRKEGMSEERIFVEICKRAFEVYYRWAEEQEKVFMQFERKYGVLLRKGNFVEATFFAEENRKQLQEAAESLQNTREGVRELSRRINSVSINFDDLDELRKKTRELLQRIPKK